MFTFPGYLKIQNTCTIFILISVHFCTNKQSQIVCKWDGFFFYTKHWETNQAISEN